MALTLLGIGMWIFPRLGTEFTPELNEGTIVVKLKMAPSVSIETSKQMTQVIEARILEVPEVTKVVTRIGRGEVGAHADPINAAELYLIMIPPDQWEIPFDREAVVEEIREAIGEPSGVIVNYTQPIEMTVDELLEGVQAGIGGAEVSDSSPSSAMCRAAMSVASSPTRKSPSPIRSTCPWAI